MFNFLKRDVLIGIGAGFIISGIMISAFGIGQPTDEQIKERAAKLGMVQTIESLKEHSQSSQPEQQKPAPPEQTKSASNEKPQPTTSEQSDNSVTDSKSKVSGTQKVSFEIKPGMGSETIARLLEDKGVIKDRNAFYNLVTTHKAHSSFRTGVFKLTVGGDIEEILKILTGK